MANVGHRLEKELTTRYGNVGISNGSNETGCSIEGCSMLEALLCRLLHEASYRVQYTEIRIAQSIGALYCCRISITRNTMNS